VVGSRHTRRFGLSVARRFLWVALREGFFEDFYRRFSIAQMRRIGVNEKV
jgi:hypothetical protein